VNRRRFLVVAGGTAAAGGGLSLVLSLGGCGGDPALATIDCGPSGTVDVRIGDFFPEPERARPLGRVVLAGERFRPTASELADRLFADEAWGDACRDGARKVLRERIRADFAGGRVRAVDGWTLSATEADLCALTELVLGS